MGVGLLIDVKPAAGYLHFPVLRQTFSCEGGLALLNGEPMPTRQGQLLPDTLNIMITAVHEIRRCMAGRGLPAAQPWLDPIPPDDVGGRPLRGGGRGTLLSLGHRPRPT